MALAYTEFDAFSGTIPAAVKQAVLKSSDWAHLQLTTGTAATTLSSGASAGATSISTVATIPSGSYIVIGNGAANPEVRLTTAVSGAGPFTVSWSASEPLVASYSSGAAIGVGSYIKATTTRGSQMVIDLVASAPTTLTMTVQAYYTHDGTTAVGASGNRLIGYKRNTGATTNVIHCRVSAHKDGLYIDTEGPRNSETGTDSATWGSFRNAFYIGDIAPYDASDTVPCVILCAGTSGTSATNQDVRLSRNRVNTQSWTTTFLRTLTYPVYNTSGATGNSPPNAANGDYVACPWVVFEAGDGLRGRLSYLHYGGIAGVIADVNEPPAPPQNTEMIYGSFKYKALYPFKTDSNNSLSHSFGFVNNGGVPNATPVLWVPTAVYP